MKGFVPYITSSFLSAFAICHSPVYSIELTTAPIQENTSVVQDASWTAQIEREIRKNDSWVEWYIEQNYTNATQEGYAHLRRVPRERQGDTFVNPNNPSGVVFLGMWDPQYDLLEFPDPWDEEHGTSVLGAVDHELWHAFYRNGKGVLSMEGFNGPTTPQIGQYCYERSGSKEYLPVAQEIETTVREAEVSIFIATEETRVNYIEELYVRNQNSSGLEALLTEDEKQMIQSDQQRISIRVLEYAMTLSTIEPAYNSFTENVDSDTDPILFEKGMVGMKKYVEKLAPYKTIEEEIFDVNEMHRYIFYNAIAREVNIPIVALEKKLAMTPAEQQDALLHDLRALEQKQQEYLALVPRGFVDDVLVLRAQNLVSTRDKIIQETKMRFRARLFDPDEFMGRVFDSLYSLYYGPYTYQAAPLNEKDLAFLESFTYNGQPVFRKGVEKYRVGLEMIADGKKPEDIKELLEYAISLEYKGKMYSWPEANFHLVLTGGELPVAEN